MSEYFDLSEGMYGDIKTIMAKHGMILKGIESSNGVGKIDFIYEHKLEPMKLEALRELKRKLKESSDVEKD
jgi:hypothetical protein